MPLYTDSNYYYTGGSSQLYSPYYPVSSTATPTSSGLYSPYTSTYSRSLTGSYIVPVSTSRSSSYSSPHGLSSRYQPKLSTITETSPLISASRNTSLMPLTRIQSPKYTSYSSPSTLHTPKYIPPRPILINTADIDVSANRYRKRKEEVLRQAQRNTEYSSPTSSVKRKNSSEIKSEQQEVEEQKLKNEAITSKPSNEPAREPSPEQQHVNRSTIRRNRAVVRLSTIRSRSKDPGGNKLQSDEVPEKKFKDLPTYEPPETDMPFKWRERLADDLANIPSYPNKKSPGEVLKEKYLIQDNTDDDNYAAQCRAERLATGLPMETIEQVIVEIDPLHHTVRRLSIPQCPTFHDICEDISSDKIDDDLNAGELRRRASIIQSQEQEILNELQKSASGTFQMITLERRDSHDSIDLEIPTQHKRQSKRSSKKGKKIRTKITAIVDVDNAPVLTAVIPETPEELDPGKSPKPKFTVNVESIEEHHEIQKVFKLPKKKSIKRMAKAKEQNLPEGFMSSLPKPQVSPKKKIVKPIAEVFTFDEKAIEELKDDKRPSQQASQSVDESRKPVPAKILEKSNSINVELKTPTTPKTLESKTECQPLTPKSTNEQPPKMEEQKKLSTSMSVQSLAKSKLNNNSLNVEMQTPTTPQTPENKNVISPPAPLAPKTVTQDKVSSPKTLKTSLSKDSTAELKLSVTAGKLEEKKVLRTSQSLDNVPKTTLIKNLEKSNSTNVELKSPKTPTTPTKSTLKQTIKEEIQETEQSKPIIATPKPIKKAILKSDSGEDFWAQIGTRETLYMNKRKKEVAEKQWQKREDLLESTLEEEVKNIEDIKTKLISQKVEALKKAELEQQNSGGIVSRSNSNESALKKKSPIKNKEEQTVTESQDVKLEDKKKISPLKKKPATDKTGDKPKTPVELKDFKSSDNNMKTNDKLDNAKTPVVTKMSKETSLSTTSPTATTATTTTTSNTTTSPKIAGQPAKSPEPQELAEQSKCFPTTQAKNNNNKNEIDINKMGKTKAEKSEKNESEQLAKTFNLAKESITITSAIAKTTTTTVATTAKSSQNTAESTTTKQAETKQIAKITEAQNKSNAVTKSKSTDNDSKSKTNNKSPIKTKGKASPSTINADQFMRKAKTTTSSPITSASTTAALTSSSNNNNTPTTAAKTTNKNPIAANQINAATAITTETTNTTETATLVDNKEKSKINENNSNNSTTGTGGSNLSKFATVQNLAQCLQDVDADLADYLPSSAEISEDEDYSDFDYSSIDGWEKLTPSMKKKVKQRHRKEKQAEQARFDPQKKVKIDTTRKLYVKDEAPRFPLVATPRPLWKREKIIYPDDDSDDESDSEESGSTEEATEDSDECTTSEEYEDEISHTASGGGKSGSNSSDPNKENPAIIRMSTCSNDSGFEGGTAPASPKKMLETSYTYAQFQKSGRFTPPATIIPRFKNYSVDDFHFLAVLGKGSFGKVLLAELRDTTYYYAVKCLKKDVVLEDDDIDSTLIERKVLALGTKHPYLCHLFCTFQTESHLFFVMEYLNGGDLMFHIQESGRFTEERARFYGAEIVSGLKFLHKKGIIYRDLKLDNVLLDYEGHVRIADFGMCKLQIYLDKTADSFCGTPDYMAPEIIKGDKYNQNVDWWSFGVLLYEMLIGQSPFSGCDEDELFWSICNELPWFPVYISSEATSILKGLLEKDHTKRIGSHYSPAGDIVEHIFFRPIDWNLLEKRQIEPPFRPQVKHPLDTQYFDRVFTKERVRLTPIDKDILQSMDQKQFLGFTYTNPHITLD